MKRILVSAFLLSFQLHLCAQEKLNAITTPTSPASYIIGLQPSAVLNPKTFRAFETALFSNFQSEGNFTIPNDLSLEFTPYWAKDHGLTIEEYLFPGNLGTQLVRNASFSLASTQKYLLGDSSRTNAMGLGFRTSIYFGGAMDATRVSDYRKKIISAQQFSSRIGSQAEALAPTATSNEHFFLLITPVIETKLLASGWAGTNDLLKKIMTRARNSIKINVVSKPYEFLDAFYHVIDQETAFQDTFGEFKKYIQNRIGLTVDLAYSGMVSFPSNNFEAAYSPRHAVWITPSYRFSGGAGFLNVSGVFRYELMNDNYYRKYFPGTKTFVNNKDYGLAIAADFKKFVLQFEAVGRSGNAEIAAGMDAGGNLLYRKEKDNDFQYIGSFSYRITDQVALTYQLGKKFEPLHNPFQTLVSLLSLNLGFGSPTSDNIK